MRKSKIFKVVSNMLIKPKKVRKEISSVFNDNKGYVIVNFTDGTKARFYKKYSHKLLKENIVEFKTRRKGRWLNPDKNPNLKVVKQAPLELITGTLHINYVSRFKKDEKGEYVYLPKCTLNHEKDENINAPALIYLDTVNPEIELAGIFQGYGKIDGIFAKLGSVFSVEKINSFEAEIRTIEERINLSEVDFHLNSISVKTNQGVIDCPAEKVPFPFTPGYNALKEGFNQNIIHIRGTQRKVGKVHKEGNKWIEETYWIQHGEQVWDFSLINSSKIVQTVQKQKMDEEYEKLLMELKELKEFVSFTTLKKKFKKTGRTLTDKDISALFFHSGYDEEVFHILEDSAKEIYVDNLSFVFKIYDDNEDIKYVWEVPNRTLATYIFKGKLEPEQLFARLKETMRMDIRTNKEIQEALGFEGFIVHTTVDAWNNKFDSILKN